MRIWLIFGYQCAETAYADDREHLLAKPASLSRMLAAIRAWWSFQTWSLALSLTEIGADLTTLWSDLSSFVCRTAA